MGASELFADVPKLGENVTLYRGALRPRHVIVGGIPSSPSVIESWIRATMKMKDSATQELLDRTLEERKALGEVAAYADTDDAIQTILADPNLAPSINGFKRIDTAATKESGDRQLVYEGRNFKAALREAINSSYPGTDWNRTSREDLKTKNPKRKGLMATAAERVFVDSTYLPLWVLPEESEDEFFEADENGKQSFVGDLDTLRKAVQPVTSSMVSPTPEEGVAWVEERIKHVVTPQGPRSSVNRVEVVKAPVVFFELKVHDDFLPRDHWGRIWLRCEDIGIGADRGRSDGQFDLLAFERV